MDREQLAKKGSSCIDDSVREVEMRNHQRMTQVGQDTLRCDILHCPVD
jgi:hypothetical protein